MEDVTVNLSSKRNDDDIRRLATLIRQTAYDIHLYFGTGFLEKVYENALKHRLEKLGVKVDQQVYMLVHDQDGQPVGKYQADLIVDECIIVELKTVTGLNAAHEAQLINYLKTTGIRDGLLINFGSQRFEAIKRVFDSSPHNPNKPQFVIIQAPDSLKDKPER